MNKVFLSGNLTRDPEVRYTQNGKPYARCGIAVNRPFSKDTVDFFNLVAFDKTADFIGKYFSKGSRILIEGRLQTSTYKNKQGVDVSATDIMIDNVEFAGGKREDKPATNAPPKNNASPPQRNDYGFSGESVDPTDMPF